MKTRFTSIHGSAPRLRITGTLIVVLSTSTPIATYARAELPDWPDPVAVYALDCEYVSEQGNEVQQFGRWCFRTFPAFANMMTVTTTFRGEFSSERFACYDAERGLAHSYLRIPRTLRGSGEIGFSVPHEFGFAVLPSNSHFFFSGTRTIRDYFELHRAEVVTEGGPSPRRLVYCRTPETPGSFRLFVLTDEESPVIVEQRSYDRRPSVLARISAGTRIREDFVPPLPLPGGCDDSIVFCASTVLETSSVDEVVIPTKWVVRHCYGSTTTISLVPETVRINEAVLQEDCLLPFPSGTEIIDRRDGNAYFVDQSGNKRREEILTNASLTAILRELGVEGQDDQIRPLDYVTSCGANSLCVMLATNDRFAELSDIADELGVQESGSDQTLAELRDAAATFGLSLSAVSDAEQILYGGSGARILAHVKRRKRDGTVRSHYLVADSYDRDTDTLRIIDLPRIPYRVTRDVFDRDWTGNALVLDAVASNVIAARSSAMRLLSIFGTGAVVGGVALALGRLARRRSRDVADSLFCWAWLVVGGSGVACNSEAKSHAHDSASIEVVGASEVDLGQVRWQRGFPAISHTFVVGNTSKRPVRIVDITSSCSCLDVQPSTNLLEPGGESQVKLRIRATSGSRELVKAFCSVAFDDPSISPIVLRVKAIVERAYMVLVVPSRWEVAGDQSPAGVLEKTFLVREFRHQSQPDALTSVEIEGQRASVEQIGDWKFLGERAYGFCRESRVKVSVDISERKRPFRDSLLLRFRSQVEDESGEAADEEFEAKVNLEA